MNPGISEVGFMISFVGVNRPLILISPPRINQSITDQCKADQTKNPHKQGFLSFWSYPWPIECIWWPFEANSHGSNSQVNQFVSSFRVVLDLIWLLIRSPLLFSDVKRSQIDLFRRDQLCGNYFQIVSLATCVVLIRYSIYLYFGFLLFVRRHTYNYPL